MAKRIEWLINDREDLGYTSVSVFIEDAARRRLEELEKMLREEKALQRKER
jgi:hypothetical protein